MRGSVEVSRFGGLRWCCLLVEIMCLLDSLFLICLEVVIDRLGSRREIGGWASVVDLSRRDDCFELSCL
jgi:hypothetical protein